MSTVPRPTFRSRIASGYKWEITESWIPNNGSCRDYCATERTALSYLRLTLILSVLSTTLIAKVRIPGPKETADSPSRFSSLEDRAALPLGVLFAILALLNLFTGTRVYWKAMRGLREGKGFVGADLLNTIILVAVAMGILTSIVILIVAHAGRT